MTATKFIRCIDCKHWQGDRNIDPDLPLRPVKEEWRDGICDELDINLDIRLLTGYDGALVDEIRTVATFGCAFGEEL